MIKQRSLKGKSALEKLEKKSNEEAKRGTKKGKIEASFTEDEHSFLMEVEEKDLDEFQNPEEDQESNIVTFKEGSNNNATAELPEETEDGETCTSSLNSDVDSDGEITSDSEDSSCEDDDRSSLCKTVKKKSDSGHAEARHEFVDAMMNN